jgi:hypothetical protein
MFEVQYTAEHYYAENNAMIKSEAPPTQKEIILSLS